MHLIKSKRLEGMFCLRFLLIATLVHRDLTRISSCCLLHPCCCFVPLVISPLPLNCTCLCLLLAISRYCGGCLHQCLPKSFVCPNKKPPRACVGTANFCLNVKACASSTAQCFPDPCDSCTAKCVEPCPAGKFLNKLTLTCEECPAGFACPAGGKKQRFPGPQPCSGGRFSNKKGQKLCRKCPRGSTTAKSSIQGFTKCSKIK